jgi:hypothetical protein
MTAMRSHMIEASMLSTIAAPPSIDPKDIDKSDISGAAQFFSILRKKITGSSLTRPPEELSII